MSKYFSSLKLKDYLSLTVLIAVGFGWLLVDQIFLPEVYQRFIAFIIIILVLYFFQFYLNKPSQVIKYANSIALITASFTIIVILILHVIIRHDFSYKNFLICIISATLPYISGLIYLKTKKTN